MKKLLLLFWVTTLACPLFAGTVTDYDGNVYQTVIIGTQEWMAENLKVAHYRNGDVIPNVTDSTVWSSLSTGAYCIYPLGDTIFATYGCLYNWFTISDGRDIAPAGWHVPSDAEWKQLEMYLGMSQAQADAIEIRGTIVGGKLKETGNNHWASNNSGATNESGFAARGGGVRKSSYGGFFQDILQFGAFWSSTDNGGGGACGRTLSCYWSGIYRFINGDKKDGFSIRCVKDNPNDIDEHGGTNRQAAFNLTQNHPNPFNPTTTIQYSLPSHSHVMIEVFNLLGQRVRQLIDETKAAGSYQINWDGTDQGGKNVATGIYFYRLQTEKYVETKKMVLLK